MKVALLGTSYSSGMKKIDDLFLGGIPSAKHVLVLGSAGSDVSVFANHVVNERLEKGKKCAFLINDKKPSALFQLFDNLGYDIKQYEEKTLFVVDSYSALIGIGNGDNFDPSDINQVLEHLLVCLDKLDQGDVLAIDSLSTLLEISQSHDLFLEKMKDIFNKAADKGISVVSVFTNWEYEKDFLNDVTDLFDAVINVRSIGDRIILKDYFSVSKASWVPDLKPISIPFTVLRPGGLRVFIPKIIVTGSLNSGKSSFIHSASIKAVSVDRLGTTVALDHGFIDYKGFSADLFGTPGQERFDPIISLLGHEALGVIVVLDATRPETYPRAEEMLGISKTEGLPKVIVANKIDLPNAASIEEIKNQINIDAPIVPVRAEDLSLVKEKEPCKLRKEDIIKVFDELFATIL